jgi:anthranilate synthase component 1
VTAAGKSAGRHPLPRWGASDLAAALPPGPVAVLEGLTAGGRPCALVAWSPGPTSASVDEALGLAAALPLPPDSPPLLGAAVGTLDWNGSAQFWVPQAAALFDPAAGCLWVRGAVPDPDPSPIPDPGPAPDAMTPARTGWTRDGFCAAVREAQRRMDRGEIEKVILSVPFTAECPLPPLAVYRRLTAGDPPGLRFLLDGDSGAGALMGVSPEPLVLLAGRRAEVHLLAGTRPDEEGREAELLHSPKDWWEHGVAAEQARRDLLSCCLPESVLVDSFMRIERHPGLVHLASHLSGTLRDDVTPGGLVAACFPAGTVGGVPRDPAVRLIAELEPAPRGWYAGAVGAVLPDGGLQLWLTIRSLHLQGGIGHVRTGAGLVPESKPEAEWQECLNKARRALGALGAEVSLHDAAGV